MGQRERMIGAANGAPTLPPWERVGEGAKFNPATMTPKALILKIKRWLLGGVTMKTLSDRVYGLRNLRVSLDGDERAAVEDARDRLVAVLTAEDLTPAARTKIEEVRSRLDGALGTGDSGPSAEGRSASRRWSSRGVGGRQTRHTHTTQGGQA